MTAAEALRTARASGVRVMTDGRDLLLEARTPPPPQVLNALGRHKREVITLLQTAGHRSSAEDWQAYYDERAAVREYDGGLPRGEAEQLAFEDTVTQWLCLHPAPASNPQEGCVHCGAGDQPGNTLIAVLAAEGFVWVHDGCWKGWQADRRRQASMALQRLGLASAFTRAHADGP